MQRHGFEIVNAEEDRNKKNKKNKAIVIKGTKEDEKEKQT
jgi:hypothetical protein